MNNDDSLKEVTKILENLDRLEGLVNQLYVAAVYLNYQNERSKGEVPPFEDYLREVLEKTGAGTRYTFEELREAGKGVVEGW